MFKALILQAQHTLSDAWMEFMIRDRLSWMRFLGFDPGAPTPDGNTIRPFRDRLTDSGTLKRVIKAFDWRLRKKGCIPPPGDCGRSPAGQRMSGQIVDASLVPAPKRRNTDGGKEAVKAGKSAREIWPDEPDKAAQKDTDARFRGLHANHCRAEAWTLKIGGKVRYRPDGTPLPMIAAPVFGYRSHIRIDPLPGNRCEASMRGGASASSARAPSHRPRPPTDGC